jgi:Asp-tRNA(Asn)/Glu-tRNA(Gln) amidotransferase A subunit family amidase
VTVLGRLRRGADTAVATVERQLELLRRAHVVTDAVVAFEDERALADAAALDRAFARRGRSGRCTGCR